jgi:hypothetical protein
MRRSREIQCNDRIAARSGVDDGVVTVGLPIGNVLADLVDVRVDVALLARQE